MNEYRRHEKKRRTRLWIAALLLSVTALVASLLFMGPPPPRKIVLATGQSQGAYAVFGSEYRKRLEPMGLRVELVHTNGSIDNLQRLLRGEVDVAFVQGGTYGLVLDPGSTLRGLAAIYLQPVWVFYRGDHAVLSLAQLQGRRVALGPSDSGTAAVSSLLLKAHGITPDNTTLLSLPTNAESRRRLLDGTLDVAFFISGYQDETVQQLLHRRDVRLMDFQRHAVAYSRQFPYLTRVTLAQGVLDLRDDVPAQEQILLAPAALLACRENLHPRAVELILAAAQSIHGPGSLLDRPGQFPSLEGVDLPVHDAAETYLKSGESYLARLLPYWGVRLVFLVQILLLPLLAIWLPFLKILPMLYGYRVSRLLKKHYTALREVETDIGHADQPADLRERLKALENLRTAMESLSRKIPSHLQGDVYHWRLHVALVRTEALDRLRRLEAPAEGRP